ncbi:hypothetical protein HP548_02545 [Paenibacillus taichungensis]|uniref:Uncharacterized protein n=1 Tax=Paenibacillus taichungensis TaxID=484184 RepID=A0ABX2MF06_9BACL|nr:hypothetical protein [Paenibacillus taichungensis]NUU52974.1 hypothetical protein [Paenibacillus taichungensis]
MKVERTQEGGLKKQEWFFIITSDLSGHKINVSVRDYFSLKRESKRHAFKTCESYEQSRWYKTGPDRVSKENVPLPQDVLDEVKKRLVAGITFNVSID